MSRVLLDVKEKNKDEVILIPIAADTNVNSVELLMKSYNVEKIPTIIINDKILVSELIKVEEIESYLD